MSNEPKVASTQRREAARQAARAAIQKDKKKAAVRKILLQVSIAIASVAAIVGVGLIINSAAAPVSGPVAGPANMISGGVVFDEGLTVRETGSYRSDESPVAAAITSPNTPHVVIFLDYSCPACQGYEAFFGDLLTEKAFFGEITLEYQIIAFRDESTAGTRYSSRSANAAVCVADQAPEAFLTYHEILFANQPDMSTNFQLTDTQLIDFAVDSGVEDREGISECIKNETFTPWIAANTVRAFDETPLPVTNARFPNITGTPTTLINGLDFTGVDLDEMRAAIADAAG